MVCASLCILLTPVKRYYCLRDKSQYKVAKQKKLVIESLKPELFTMYPKTNPLSDCWKCFEVVFAGTKETDFVKCKNCQAIYKYCSKTGTSKLLAHYIEKHQNQPKIAKYSTHKKLIPDSAKELIIRHQVDFCVDMNTSFRMQESEGFVEFCNFLIKMGNDYGHFDIQELLAKRNKLKVKVLQQSDEIEPHILQAVHGKSVSFTADIWSSKYRNDSFLDIHIVFVEGRSLRYCQIEMVPFDEKHSAENIKKRMIEVFDRYGKNEITITTDCGRNILKSVEGFVSIKCACHRLSTSIDDAWANCLLASAKLKKLDSNCNLLLKSLSHSVDIQSKLPRKVKPGPRTRA